VLLLIHDRDIRVLTSQGQYFPKRSDLRAHTQADLDAVAAELNNRPRPTLDWLSPSEALDEALR
jgi:transposase, IS30 family